VNSAAVPEVVYYVAASLDGFIATSDGGIKWLSPFEGKGEDYGYAAFYASIDAVLLGRRTYEQCLTFGEWPYPGKPCWVFSHGRIKIAGPGVTLTIQDPHEMVSELQARKLRRAWLVGGSDLAGSFRDEGLISEYIVSVVPVILGAGIPLFASGRTQEVLKLVETNAYPSGIVQLRYLRGVDA
jgi:dihydrofolate reductase